MEIQYWTSTHTQDYYVAEFIDTQSCKMQKKIIRDLELIEKYGTSFQNIKKMKGYNMHEITIKNCRILCAIRGQICWLLHAFVKKSNKTPLRHISTAFNRMKDLDQKLSNLIIHSKYGFANA